MIGVDGYCNALDIHNYYPYKYRDLNQLISLIYAKIVP